MKMDWAARADSLFRFTHKQREDENLAVLPSSSGAVIG
jgi:hypothetical protein